jgi:hypothetical protein
VIAARIETAAMLLATTAPLFARLIGRQLGLRALLAVASRLRREMIYELVYEATVL